MKFENTEVWGFQHALRGMRNPMNSWDKSDSFKYDGFIIGSKDRVLAQKLIRAGSEHRKFMRQIFVSVDITAPLYWWKEFDTYKVGTVANSCSTMHKIHEKEFTVDDFSCNHLTSETEGLWKNEYGMIYKGTAKEFFGLVIQVLNHYRDLFLETKNRSYWWQMIQLLPSSYNQKRTVTMNYENIFSMVRQREGHKLTEWSEDFLNWAKSLPYAKELIFLNEEETTV